MLSKFSVKNFRNFTNWFEFNFITDKNYEFNSEVISNKNVVKHSMVYGQNGCGKSNLGLAILDLTCHLSDSSVMPSLKTNYINARAAQEGIAEFQYEFIFENTVVVYSYGKSTCFNTVYEILKIDGKECVSFDRRKSGLATFELAGAQSLKNDLTKSEISAVKYLSSNAVLDDNHENNIFNKFMSFVKGMVFFRTLTKGAEVSGHSPDSKRLSHAIIESNKVQDFEQFLNNAGIECNLIITGDIGDQRIAFDFDDGNTLEFSLVASTGTMSLGVFYYWWLKLESGILSFAYIDEFDAYYHYALSKLIINKISEIECQTVLTTHNTGLMSNDLLRPDCYSLLADKQYRFDQLVNKDLRKAHNLEKIFKGLK